MHFSFLLDKLKPASYFIYLRLSGNFMSTIKIPSRRLPASKKDNAWAGCNAGYLDVSVWLHLCELLAMVEHVLNL